MYGKSTARVSDYSKVVQDCQPSGRMAAARRDVHGSRMDSPNTSRPSASGPRLPCDVGTGTVDKTNKSLLKRENAKRIFFVMHTARSLNASVVP